MAPSDPNQPVNNPESLMPFETKKSPTARFVVFRIIVSLLFLAPVVYVRLNYDLVPTLVALAACFALYAVWENWFMRRLSEEETEAYRAVFDNGNPTKVFRVRDYAMLCLAVIILALAAIFAFI